jgi:hypothetical protein
VCKICDRDAKNRIKLTVMLGRRAYPPELARHVRERWPAEHPLALSSDLLTEALSVAFEASLTSEEARPTRFRLLLSHPDTLPENGRPNEGVLRLKFDESRPLNASELRNLSPAVPFDASLIGAHPVDDHLRIWGIAHSGPAWLAPTWGGRSLVPNWSYDPIVHVNGPGRLAVRCAGKLVAGLERGVLIDATMDVFESNWLRNLFAREREEVQAEHAAGQARAPIPTAADQSLVGRVGQHMLRRAIQLIRGARHGGMLLFVDGPLDPGAPVDTLGLRYRFDSSEPPRRYRTLLFQILDLLAAGTTNPSMDWSDYERDDNPELEKLELSVFEMSRVIASLAAIDGAVVLDKRFAIVGFGAVVSGALPSPVRVWRAGDVEGGSREPAAIEDVGTRHRAAYRFVRHHPRGVAIVISQDGGITFVAERDGEVVFWEQSVGP